MRKFYSYDYGDIITEADLRREYEENKKRDPEEYNYTFEQYITNCTSKNGALAEIRASYCEHCLEAIRSRGEKLQAIHVCPDFPEDDAADDPDAPSYCDWCEEAGHSDIYIVI